MSYPGGSSSYPAYPPPSYQHPPLYATPGHQKYGYDQQPPLPLQPQPQYYAPLPPPQQQNEHHNNGMGKGLLAG